MKIRFVTAYTVKDSVGTHYKDGQVCDLSDASAMHFLSRGLAVEVGEEAEPPPEPPVKEEKREHGMKRKDRE